MYYAICELAKKSIVKIDAYNITNILNARENTKAKADTILSVSTINDFIMNAPNIARSTVEEYKLIVDRVLNAAFRRDTFNKLVECQHMCFNANEAEIEQKIYSALDDVMMEFSTVNDVPQYKDVVDAMWAEIKSRQDSGISGIPFKFPTLNEYATLEPGELFIFAAEAKEGKSMMLLNQTVDLLKQGLSVLYIDSELNTRMFTARLVAHLSKIEYSRVRSGKYNKEEEKRINDAIKWVKSQKFTHIYMPMFDAKTIYTTVKRVKHTQTLDAIVIDYFKSSGEQDAFATYQEMGRLVDQPVPIYIENLLNCWNTLRALCTTAGR